jgi:hypothetical protein
MMVDRSKDTASLWVVAFGSDECIDLTAKYASNAQAVVCQKNSQIPEIVVKTSLASAILCSIRRQVMLLLRK